MHLTAHTVHLNSVQVNGVHYSGVVPDVQPTSHTRATPTGRRSRDDVIDAALGMAGPDGLLPERLAIDGLHLDIEGKKQIAAAVNAGWPRIIVSPWSND